MFDRSWLGAEGGNAGDRSRVTEFNMAWSDDTAERQHVQRDSFLFLARSAQLYVTDRRREDVHRVFLPCRGDEAVCLHPEYSTEIFIESARTLALTAAGKKFAGLRLHVPPKNQLILMASAEGASFPV